MKKLFPILLSLVLLGNFMACSDDTKNSNDPQPTLILDKSEVTIYTGSTALVTVTALNPRGEVEGFSIANSNEDFLAATIDGEVITLRGVAQGTSTITVTSTSGLEEVCEVTVEFVQPYVFESKGFPGGTYNYILAEGEDNETEVKVSFNEDNTFYRSEIFLYEFEGAGVYELKYEVKGTWDWSYNEETKKSLLEIGGDATIALTINGQVLQESYHEEVYENAFIVDNYVFLNGFLRTSESTNIYAGNFTNNYIFKQTGKTETGELNEEDVFHNNSTYTFDVAEDFSFKVAWEILQTGKDDIKGSEESFLETNPDYKEIFVFYEGNYYWYPFQDEIHELETEEVAE